MARLEVVPQGKIVARACARQYMMGTGLDFHVAAREPPKNHEWGASSIGAHSLKIISILSFKESH